MGNMFLLMLQTFYINSLMDYYNEEITLSTCQHKSNFPNNFHVVIDL